jgi:outer membrane receptor protein involved in Fe transport
MRISKVRTLLFASTALILTGAAYADEPVETVVVTGTRIPRPQYDLPNPVTELGADQIQQSGTADLGDFLRRIPALEGSLGNYALNGYGTPAADDGASLGGLNLPDLRNLGYVRTLVLIDGKRSVSELPNSAAVDINTIPITLVDRVDVETGGASAIYGADGVSGVVNFIMKHDLQGVHARAQVGTSQDGGGSTFITAVSAGQNFDDDKGNITLTAEGTYQDHLFFTQRKFTSVGHIQYFVPNPANLDGSNLSLPANIPTPDAQFELSAPTGAIWSDWNADFDPDFLGNGHPFIVGDNSIGNASQIGGSGMPYANDLQGDLQPTERRLIGQIDSKYEFSNYFNVSFSFKWAHIDSKSVSSAPFDDFTVISSDNAFLPANVAAAINSGSFAPYGVLSEDYLSIRNKEEVKRDTFRPVLDISGDLPNPSFLEKFHYDLSFVYGQTDIDDIDENNRVSDRFFAALDSVLDPVTHLPVCRSNLNPSAVPPDISLLFGPGNEIFSDTVKVGPGNYPQTFTPGPNSGCVPFNPFGPHAASKAAIAWVTANTHTRSAIQQEVVTGFVGADVPAFKDAGFAGPLTIIAGAEYRREISSSDPDALQAGDDAWISGSPTVRGAFDVWEVFGEATAPLVADQPFVKELTLSAAIRNSHYSTAGVDTSWNYGGVYSPFDGLKFRATEAYAVRAPNIGELFAPLVNLFSGISDPCDFTSVHAGTSFRPANCQAIEDALLGPGVYNPNIQADSNLNTGATTPITIGGNTKLQPETARTLTAGFVVQKPEWGLTFTADFYDVKINHAIQALSGTDVASECVDLSTINNPFCAAVTRTDTGSFPGSISHVSVQEINVASFATAGIDYSIDYSLNTEDIFGKNYGELDFHVIGNWLDHLSFQSLAGEAPVQGAGTLGGGFDGQPAPRYQDNLDINWTYGNWKVDYNINWYSHVLRSSIQALKSEPNVYAKKYLYIPDLFEHSIQVDYGYKGWDLYAGVNNLFYQKPAIGESAYPVDPIGRFFYIGVKADLDGVDFGF